MKKILILTVCNPLEWSGIEKVMNEVWKTLGKSWKYKVTYLFSWDWKIEENDWIIYKSVKIPKIKWINYILYDLKLPKYIRNENPDLIIDNMWNSYFYQLFWKRRKNKILSVCHWTPRDFKYLSKHPPYNSIFDKIFNWFWWLSWIITHTYSIKKSDYIVTLSKELKTRLIDNWVPENKIHIIYNWYDPKDIEIKQHDWIKILFISNDHIRKWIDILENVANYYIKNDNIKFYVIWKSYESLHKNVISKWKMKRDELYNFMAESDIIFLPSYCEWQPLVVLEAMWFWCIPVISKECHMDILYWTPFEKYINNDNSVQRYITEINDILDNKSEQNLHETAKKIISDFTWDIQSQKYLSLIDKYI
jgi:hypothetical protein